MATTKLPVTYGTVRAGDEIDGIVIMATHRNEQDANWVTLQFADTLAWGPWTHAGTPVSVYRLDTCDSDCMCN